MKFLFITHDLIVEKWHLMPWRTLVEVVSYININGHEAELLSLSNTNDPFYINDHNLLVNQINKNHNSFQHVLIDFVKEKQPNVIYWPLSWRESLKRTKIAGLLKTPLIGYFPGGSYTKLSSLFALKRLGLHGSLPYLLEAFFPLKFQINHLKKNGFKQLIAITDYTANKIVKAGWAENNVCCIPPGKEENKKKLTPENMPENIKTWLDSRSFYLFMGPPSAIRGVYEMLAAFDKAAETKSDFCLVCLFRSDGILETEKIKKTISGLKHKDRVYSIWGSLTKDKLSSFIQSCHGLIQPFVLVPSEIPLAIIENMEWGKPVIVTNNEGTGKFVSSFGIQIPPGSTNRLSKAMIELIDNKSMYSDKCKTTLELYKKHPAWNEVSQMWLEVGLTLKA